MLQTQVPSLLQRLGSLTAIRDSEMLEQSLLRTLVPMLGIPACSLYRVNDRNDFIRAIHYRREVNETDKDSDSVVEQTDNVYNQIEASLEVQDLIDDVRRTQQATSHKRRDTMLNAYPVFGNAYITGYLLFESRRPVVPTEDAIITGVLQVYRNYYTLLEESQRDKLTGLLNRHALDQGIDRILTSLAHRSNHQPLGEAPHEPLTDGRRRVIPQKYWLAIIDIDHFKPVNDTYGHVIGDEVLLMVARIMQRALRESDLLYRYGGEEFIAITSTEDSKAIAAQLERVRQKVEAYDFPQAGKMTVSIGYTHLDSRISSHEVISCADQALYFAKNNGRNQIANYSQLVSAGILKEVSYGSIDLF